MSNELMPKHSGLIAFNKTTSAIFAGKQFGDTVATALKSSYSSYALSSKTTSEALSNNTKQMALNVSSLMNPPSPASLPASSEAAIKDRLFDATAAVKILTSQVAMHLDKKLRDKLFSQLDLIHDLDEWDRNDKPIKKLSFATFLKAILQIKPQRGPGLGLTYEGHLIAAWTTGQDRLTTEFLPNNRVRWVLTRTLDGEVERANGETTVARLHECLLPYHPGHWFFYEED